jgi:hypothetical protein
MFERLPKDFFSEDLIRAHLASEIGTRELRSRMSEAMKELERREPALAESMKGALSTAPSNDVSYGFLSGALYILVLIDRKFSSEDLAGRLWR